LQGKGKKEQELKSTEDGRSAEGSTNPFALIWEKKRKSWEEKIAATRLTKKKGEARVFLDAVKRWEKVRSGNTGRKEYHLESKQQKQKGRK